MHSYPKVIALGGKGVEEILDGDVLIQEKIDGSQFSFGLDKEGKYWASSHKARIDLNDPQRMFSAAVTYTQGQPLRQGVIYRGEVLDKPKHNVLTYSRVPTGNVILFDIEYLDPVGKCYTMPHIENHLKKYGIELEVVPTLYYGRVESKDELVKLLDTESILGGTKIEGIVIKNYSKYSPYNVGWPLMAKLVREDFKEAHKREWTPGPSLMENMEAALKTEARWEKAVQRLRENGALFEDSRDIGALIIAVKDDVFEEETDFIKEKLFDHYRKEIARAVTRGLPEWYKKKLLSVIDVGGQTISETTAAGSTGL